MQERRPSACQFHTSFQNVLNLTKVEWILSELKYNCGDGNEEEEAASCDSTECNRIKQRRTDPLPELLHQSS